MCLVLSRRLLCGKKLESSLDDDALPRVLVLRREPGRVGGEGGLAFGVDLGEGVHAFARRVQIVHEIHDEIRRGLCACVAACVRRGRWRCRTAAHTATAAGNETEITVCFLNKLMRTSTSLRN